MRLVIGILANLLFITITLVSPTHVFAMGSNQKTDEKRLYIYSRKDILNFLKNIGYKDIWSTADWKTLRNSDGTELRFSDDKREKIIAISCDGSIKEIDMPGDPTWLNDRHEPIAWFSRSKGMVLVHYKNGMFEKISFSPHAGPDPSGNYFMKYQMAPPRNTPLSESCMTEIYSIQRPDLSLATIRACGATRIFLKNGKIFLFGNDYDEKGNKISDTITMHVFQVMNTGLIEIETNTIEPTYIGMHVEDFSPWDEKVFLIKDYDPPFRSVLYEFDLGTKEMKKIGKVPFSGGRGFYLQCDIIKEVTRKLEERKKESTE